MNEFHELVYVLNEFQQNKQTGTDVAVEIESLIWKIVEQALKNHNGNS